MTATALPQRPTFTKAEALAHTERLNASIDETLDLIFEAWVGRIWEGLDDVDSWESYVEVYAPRIKTLKLPVVDRRALAAKWAAAGAPTRDFARGVNVSNGTAAGDYNNVVDINEARKVISKDGSLRPARAPKRPAAEPAPKVSKRDRIVALIAARGPMTRNEIVKATGWGESTVSGSLSPMARQGRVRPTEVFREGCAAYALTEAEAAKATA